jgi:hypothetical protein
VTEWPIELRGATALDIEGGGARPVAVVWLAARRANDGEEAVADEEPFHGNEFRVGATCPSRHPLEL